MKKIFLTLSLLVSILLMFSCTSKNEYEGFKVYENKNAGFSIQYPEDWKFREDFGKDADLGSIVFLQSPSEGKHDLFFENVHIFKEVLPDSVKNVNDYLAYSKESLPSQLSEMEILEEGKTEIDGESSRWIIFNFVNNLQRVTSIGYMFYRDGKGLVLTATSRPEDFMSKRRLFEKIAKSIKFE